MGNVSAKTNEMKTESKIQQEIFMYYHNNFTIKGKGIIFSVPNESKSKEEIRKKMATGMMPGVSDMIVVETDRVIFVEVKTDKGYQSQKQKDFQKTIENLGYKYILVRSLDEFRNEIVIV